MAGAGPELEALSCGRDTENHKGRWDLKGEDQRKGIEMDMKKNACLFFKSALYCSTYLFYCSCSMTEFSYSTFG